ncbi:MAG: ABC transporter permease [Microbispora sp.]|nr:ABC transporter permease [Microbispora sp.]
MARRRPLADFVERWGTLLGFALMIAAFWVAEPDTFGTLNNFKAILDQAAVTVLLGVGLTIVLAVGEFDLSFPYSVGLASGVATLMMTDWGLGAGVAVVMGLVAGVGAGMVAGLVVSMQRASSFIITLAIGFIWMGVADAITGGQTISSGLSEGFISITDHRVGGITLAVFVALGFSVLAAAVLRATVFGRYLQSVGSNAEAARLAGLRMARIRTAAFAGLGIGVGLSAVIITARQAQFTPDVGQGLFLQPYVAAFFGMSVLGARRFNVFGTVIGALFIGALQTGLIIVGAASWVSEVVQGAVLLVILIVIAARRAGWR